MTYTPIDAGTPNWDVPLNAGILDVQTQAQAAQTAANNAQSSANTALSNASNAQSAANTAQSTANTALSTAQAAIPQQNPGIYIPSGWGAYWRAARNAAGSGKARIAVVGSSSAQGLYASNPLTTTYVSRVMNSLQSTYGNGGSGFFAAIRSQVFLGAGALATAWGGVTGGLASTSGSWSNGNTFGPAGEYLFTQTNGNSITFIVTGTTIRIYTIGGSGRQPWTYNIDGAGAVAQSDPGGSTQVVVTTVTGLSAGSHTVVLTHNGTNGSSFAVNGVTGENNTGIIVNNFAQSGAQSSLFADTSQTYMPGTWSGGPDYPADLVIYTVGANDANAGVAGDTWASNMRAYLSTVKDGTSAGSVNATGNTDILILMQHIGKYDQTNLKWQDYTARARGIAEAFGAAMIDVWTTGRNSWNYWNGLGYWGNSASPGAAGTDSVHMSDAGHQAVANLILPVLTS